MILYILYIILKLVHNEYLYFKYTFMLILLYLNSHTVLNAGHLLVTDYSNTVALLLLLSTSFNTAF